MLSLYAWRIAPILLVGFLALTSSTSSQVGHPGAPIIWAHMGVGRVIRPIVHHAGMLESMLRDPEFNHVYFDISWDEVAKYVTASPESLKISADLFNHFLDRFLFGTDALAPKDSKAYFDTYNDYDPLWPLLTKETSLKVRIENYKRIFDEARRRPEFGKVFMRTESIPLLLT